MDRSNLWFWISPGRLYEWIVGLKEQAMRSAKKEREEARVRWRVLSRIFRSTDAPWHKPISRNAGSALLEASVMSPWRFGIVPARPRTWQLRQPASSRDDTRVSSALVAALFGEIQPNLCSSRDRARPFPCTGRAAQRAAFTVSRASKTDPANPSVHEWLQANFAVSSFSELLASPRPQPTPLLSFHLATTVLDALNSS